MNCNTGRTSMFRSLDGELSYAEERELQSHFAVCGSCAREMKLITLAKKIGRFVPAFQPSPYFYQRLRAQIAEQAGAVTIWQILLGLSRQVVPALATITLALLAVFAYVQLQGPQGDVYQAYDQIFMRPDHPTRMVIADQGEITDESVLRSIAEEDSLKAIPTETGKAK